MATENRLPASHLAKRLQQDPWRFDFFQLVRLLEHFDSQDTRPRTPLGGFYPPRNEPVRFVVNPSMGFEGGAVDKITRGGDKSLASRDQWSMAVNFWGLVGSRGVLPFHYRDLILQRLRQKDKSMKHFFDLLDHRTLSLFYRSWKKYRIPLTFEANHQLDPKYNRDRHAEMIKGLMGLASMRSAKFYQPSGDIFNVAGLMSRGVCSAEALSQAIRQHFGLKVSILHFRGQWRRMPDDVQTRLGGSRFPGVNHCLGQQAILGEKTWSVQNRFTVHFDDIDYPRFLSIVSGTEILGAMYKLIRTMAGVALDFDLSLKVRQDRLPNSQLAHPTAPPLLGWNSKLFSTRQQDRFITVSVSRHAMQRTIERLQKKRETL
ncbi:type VI secretion system baseplate subunit TssG [Hahella aquimaris]|uniref:type VI secretion system baseplate subunit TssG n=1 Tax=Hahella sp. HNIBRBA332 TaxID=3015983 RepID=UPI00273BD358|nr:type VI secretion system baseplate subunit TssG [Hahella sp. HNIBRBA332]WLQ17116.1 type VI secretion system baseplate subunit TssG [Hahella sp. HNIBRBA332]